MVTALSAMGNPGRERSEVTFEVPVRHSFLQELSALGAQI